MQIVFQTAQYAQALDDKDVKSIVVVQHFKPVVDIHSVSKNRAMIHIISEQLQGVYDNMVLNKRYEIKAFYLSANGPNGKKHDMEVHLVSIPRPMLAASYSKVAGYESLSSVRCFNSNSPLATASRQPNYSDFTSHPAHDDSTSVVADFTSHPAHDDSTSVAADFTSHPAHDDSTSVVADMSSVNIKRKLKEEEQMETMHLSMKHLKTDCEMTKRVILLVHYMNHQENSREIVVTADNVVIKFGRFIEQ